MEVRCKVLQKKVFELPFSARLMEPWNNMNINYVSMYTYMYVTNEKCRGFLCVCVCVIHLQSLVIQLLRILLRDFFRSNICRSSSASRDVACDSFHLRFVVT